MNRLHYINKIINQTFDKFVHERFVKFSKGLFKNGGPVLYVKAGAGNKNWNFNSSYEYEDQIGIFFGKTAPNDVYNVSGALYTLPRMKVEDLPTYQDKNWQQGKRELKNLHFLMIEESLELSQISEIYENLSPYCAVLLNVSPAKGKNWVMKTKEKIPSIKKLQDKDPLQECKPEKQEKCKIIDVCTKTGVCFPKRVGFSKLKTGPVDDSAVNLFFDLFLPDFPDVPRKFKELRLVNSFLIEKIELPKNKNELSSSEMRIAAIKTVKIKRFLWLDGKKFETEIEFKT